MVKLILLIFLSFALDYSCAHINTLDKSASLIFEFLIQSLHNFNLKHPKVFVHDVNFGQKLYQYFSDRTLLALIRVGFSKHTLNLILDRDLVQNHIVVINHHKEISYAVRQIFETQVLLRHGVVMFICLDCASDIVLPQGYDGLITIIVANIRSHYLKKSSYVELQTLNYLYKTRHLHLNYLGNWTWKSGFHLQKFPSSNDFQNSTFNVLCMEAEIFLRRNRIPNGNIAPEGYVWDIILLLSRMFNFSINFTFSETDIYEELRPDGTWNGVIQEFIDKRYDLLIGCFALTERRLKIVEFTVPVLREQLVIAVRRPSVLNQNSWIFTKQFFQDLYVWIAFGFIVVLLGICFKLTLKWNHNSLHINWCLLLMLVSLNKGYQGLWSLNASLFIIIVVSSLFFWMLTCYYSVFLMSLLTVNNEHLMTSVADVARSKYQIGANKGSSIPQLFAASKNPDIQLLRKSLVLLPADRGLDAVCRETNYVHIVTLNKGLRGIADRKPCQAYFVKEILLDHHYSFITPKGRILDDKLSIGLMLLKEHGILSRLMSIHNLTEKIDNMLVKDELEIDSPLYLFQLADIFIYFYIGICISLLSFIIELFCKRFETRVYDLNSITRRMGLMLLGKSNRRGGKFLPNAI